MARRLTIDPLQSSQSSVTDNSETGSQNESFSVLFYVAVISTMAKWFGKGLFQLTGYSPSLREVRAGTQVGTEAGTVEEANHWLAFPRFLIYLSCTAQAHLPRESVAHSGLGPLASTSNQENASTGQSDGGHPPAETPKYLWIC